MICPVIHVFIMVCIIWNSRMKRAGVKRTNLTFFPKTKKPNSKSIYYIK